MGLQLESTAFSEGGRIPRRFTCDGENVSPPFAWSGVPPEAAELLLVCTDPDAPSGLFHHWALFGIPPQRTALEEGLRPDSLTEGTRMAINDFRKPGYGGPCPPRGHGEHHYHFRLSALSQPVAGAGPAAGCAEVIRLARPYELEFTELVGLYGR